MSPASGLPGVAFSHDIFSAQRAGGISRCMLELMRALSGVGLDWAAWAGAARNDFLDASETQAWARGRIVGRRKPGRLTGRLGAIADEFGFRDWLKRDQRIIVHRTIYPLVDLAGSDVRRVETVHDMWDERNRAHGGNRGRLRSHFKRAALRRADLIVCVSQSTRRELLSFWPWAEPKAIVIHHGVRRLSDRPEEAGRSRPYFLFVGRRGAYKNFRVAAAALRSAALHDHELLCFGGGEFTAAERALIREEGLAGRVHAIAGDDARLAGLYEAATALLYPSSYEGFGLPLLEAMIHRCPVITAPLTAMPEVAGEAALYADPGDEAAWAAALVEAAGSPAWRADMIARGAARAALFPWAASASAHEKAYSILG